MEKLFSKERAEISTMLKLKNGSMSLVFIYVDRRKGRNESRNKNEFKAIYSRKLEEDVRLTMFTNFGKPVRLNEDNIIICLTKELTGEIENSCIGNTQEISRNHYMKQLLLEQSC